MSRLPSQSFDAEHITLRLGLGLAVAIAGLLLIWLLKLLLPWLLLLATGIAGWYRWQRHRDFQRRLYSCFYDCLPSYQGRISALDFAMAAHITGSQARKFLDARAQDFFADFEPTNYGDILYTFHHRAQVPMPAPLSKGAVTLVHRDAQPLDAGQQTDNPAANSTLRF